MAEIWGGLISVLYETSISNRHCHPGGCTPFSTGFPVMWGESRVQQGRWLPAPAVSPATRSRGQPHCPTPQLPAPRWWTRDSRTHAGCPPAHLIPSSASRAPREPQPHANPDSTQTPRRCALGPTRTPTPREAQPQPSPATPHSLYLAAGGAAAQGAAGAAHGAPARSPLSRGARSAASPGRAASAARRHRAERDGTGRDGTRRGGGVTGTPGWQRGRPRGQSGLWVCCTAAETLCGSGARLHIFKQLFFVYKCGVCLYFKVLCLHVGSAVLYILATCLYIQNIC